MLYLEVDSKIRFWKKILGLEDWVIKAVPVLPNAKSLSGAIAVVDYCVPEYKRATIKIDKEYYKRPEYNKIWDLDSIIIHELVHILLSIEKIDMPNKITNHKAFKDFEEFICDTFADIFQKNVKSLFHLYS